MSVIAGSYTSCICAAGSDQFTAAFAKYAGTSNRCRSGFPGFEATAWFALLAPAGTPANIVDRVNKDSIKTVKDPTMLARFAKFGLQPVGNSPEELAGAIKTV